MRLLSDERSCTTLQLYVVNLQLSSYTASLQVIWGGVRVQQRSVVIATGWTASPNYNSS